TGRILCHRCLGSDLYLRTLNGEGLQLIIRVLVLCKQVAGGNQVQRLEDHQILATILCGFTSSDGEDDQCGTGDIEVATGCCRGGEGTFSGDIRRGHGATVDMHELTLEAVLS